MISYFKILHSKFIVINLSLLLVLYLLFSFQLINLQILTANKFSLFSALQIYFLRKPNKVWNFKYFILISIRKIFHAYLTTYMPLFIVFTILNLTSYRGVNFMILELIFLVLIIYMCSIMVSLNVGKFIYYVVTTVIYSILSIILWKF